MLSLRFLSTCTYLARFTACPEGWTIVDNRCFKYDATTRNYKGGTVKCMEVLTPEEYEELYGESGYDQIKDELNDPPEFKNVEV